jgi:hypothetical protein
MAYRVGSLRIQLGIGALEWMLQINVQKDGENGWFICRAPSAKSQSTVWKGSLNDPRAAYRDIRSLGAPACDDGQGHSPRDLS